AARDESALAYRRRGADRQWSDVTAGAFAAEVTAVARGLIAAGVEPGDRVALLSRTRYEWTLVDYAILAVGAATVPIYETSSVEQIRWILCDAAVELKVWRIAPEGDEPGAVERLVTRGADVPEEAVLERRRAVRADDLATLIYTSGTTGRPKGCALTHRNMQTEVRSVAELFPQLLNAGGSVLLFLPLAHVFGKAIQCGATYTGTVIGHTADVSDLVGDLKVFRPTFLLAVPRVFEKVYNSACQRAHDEGKGKVFDLAADTAIAWSRARDTGGPGLVLRLKHALFDRLVLAKLRAAVGRRVVAAVSGS